MEDSKRTHHAFAFEYGTGKVIWEADLQEGTEAYESFLRDGAGLCNTSITVSEGKGR